MAKSKGPMLATPMLVGPQHIWQYHLTLGPIAKETPSWDSCWSYPNGTYWCPRKVLCSCCILCCCVELCKAWVPWLLVQLADPQTTVEQLLGITPEGKRLMDKGVSISPVQGFKHHCLLIGCICPRYTWGIVLGGLLTYWQAYSSLPSLRSSAAK